MCFVKGNGIMKRAVAIILILLMVAGVFTVIGFATTAKAADNGICEIQYSDVSAEY